MKYLFALIALALPAFALPTCNAGVQQVVRVGTTFQLDAGGSSGSGALTYSWSAVAPTQPGVNDNHSLVSISSTSAQKPTISGAFLFGPLNFHLVVTDMTGSTSCDVHHGAVQTDAVGNVQYQGMFAAKVAALLGPQTIMDRSCDLTSCTSAVNSVVDQTQFAFAYHFGQAQDTSPTGSVSFVKQWETRTSPGTVSITNSGSDNTLIGSGTTFGTTFCGGTSFPCTPPGAQQLVVVWYCTSGTAPTCFNSIDTSGRRWFAIASVDSQTQITIAAGSANFWPTTLASCSGCYYTQWTDWGMGWYTGGQNPNATGSTNDYYDLKKKYYGDWYRTGIEDFLGYARWQADAWYNSPMSDKFTMSPGFPRYRGLEGVLLRAMDEDAIAGMAGASAKWANLRTFCTNISQAAVTSQGTSLISDLRDESYPVAELADCAITDPSDNTNVDSWLTTLDSNLTNRWGPQRHTDVYGPWVGDYCNGLPTQAAPSCNDLSGGGITAEILMGSPTTVTITGGTWTTVSFCDTGNTAWVTFGTPPIGNSGWDQRGYKITYVNSTTGSLDTSYLGTFGSGKVFDLGCTSNALPAGPTTQPFMLGITSNAFRLSSYALVNSGSAPPKDAALASTINATWLPAIATWLGTNAVDTTVFSGIPARGPWYFYGGAVCLPPYGPSFSAGCSGGSTAQQIRMLSPELLAAITTGYCATRDPNLLTYGNNYYTAMFSHLPSQSGYDGDDVLDTGDLGIGGFFWGTYFAKWPAFVWGYGRNQDWLYAANGCGTVGAGGVSRSSNVTQAGNVTVQ